MLKELFEQVAEEFKDTIPNITPEMVEHMWRHKYGFIREMMAKEPGQKFLDNRFGAFTVNPKRMKKYYKRFTQTDKEVKNFEEEKAKLLEIIERAEKMLRHD